jgi:nicotinate phosphoribosyltransferase
MIDYSLDIVEVGGEDRSKRGKRGGRKHLVELEDGSHLTLPADAPAPEGARDLLVPLEELGSPDVGTLRERVLGQLSSSAYVL